MITEADILRLMVEFSEQASTPSEWAASQNIESEALVTLIHQFAKQLWDDYSDIASDEEDEDEGAKEALHATVTSMLALFAVGFELGRQYPSTPFED